LKALEKSGKVNPEKFDINGNTIERNMAIYTQTMKEFDKAKDTISKLRKQ